MSIKGTLETFNLCELLQMLAFNQKEGTLVLDSALGARTLYLDKGELTFLEGDPHICKSIERVAKREQIAAEGRIDEAVGRSLNGGRSLHSTLAAMGLVDDETAGHWFRDAVVEQLFDGQLSSVAGFEFVEGKALGPGGTEGRPVRPSLPVESLLLDVARMLDHWNTIIEVVPTPDEIYEGTGIGVDLAEDEEIDESLAEVVIPRLDGHRSLRQIAEACHSTFFAVMHIAAVLFEGGGIRAVPTPSLIARAEDLLARGEAAGAIPLLQRGIERGDAPVEARLRLADAFEATGSLEEAAAALDTFAALSSDDDAAAVFDALARALRMREGDLATAARVCDFYLRRRPWLQEYRSTAAGALRELVRGATNQGRPLEAATRLAEFIRVGDSPTADRQLLADLYAAGGDPERAGSALYEEAQLLLNADKRIPARQMLRRVLEQDSGHADARRLLLEMDGARERTHHRARIVGILVALVLVAGAAGVAWFGYRDSASAEVGDAEGAAQLATVKAEAEARKLVAAFMTQAEASADAETVDESLGAAANELRRGVRDAMSATIESLALYAEEIENYAASGQDAVHRDRHQLLSNRRAQITGEVDALLRKFVARAQQAYAEGKQAHARGQFEEARTAFRRARNLAFENTNIRNDAVQKLTIIDEYFTSYEDFAARMQAATDAKDFALATQIGVAGLQKLLDSDLSRRLPFPLRITSTPPGAEVWMGAEDTGARTPCELTYSPFLAQPVVSLRKPGCQTLRFALPAYDDIRRHRAPRPGWTPDISGTLVPGVRWRTSEHEAALTALWTVRGVPVVVGDRGRNLYSVDPIDGSLTKGTRVDPTVDLLYRGGRLPSGAQWYIHGQRTLRIQPASGESWVAHAVGRIEHPPIEVGNLLILVDQLGMVYAHALSTGEQRWRLELNAPPSQQAYASRLGILLATVNGSVYRVDPARGEAFSLAPAARGSAFALPLGESAVILGGGEGGLRIVRADGSAEPIGDAHPQFAHRPLVTESGIAWVSRDGHVRFLAGPDETPIVVTGLGDEVHELGGDPETLYATTTAGTLRAVSLKHPDQAVLSVPLGGRVDSTPIRIGNAVFLLVDGQLVAVEI